MTQAKTSPEGLGIYQPDGAVLADFLRSTAQVKVIQGPIGSGKTLACMMDLWSGMNAQHLQKDGLRKSRVIIGRTSYPELRETTVKSWLEWFPEREFGRFLWTPPFRHFIKIRDVEAEVVFVAFEDGPTAEEFFKSNEPTLVWLNEIQFMERQILTEALSRLGRYPRVLDGGAVGPRVIADMNAPDEMHWVPMMRGDVAIPEWKSESERRALKKPPNWEFFVQPPGLIEIKGADGEVSRYEENPKAENRKWLPDDYYTRQTGGQNQEWIDANVMNRVSPRKGGKPVHRQFKKEVHVARERLKLIPTVPLIIGVDFGRQPAAIFGQCLRSNWQVLYELIARDMGSKRFAMLLKREMAARFPGAPFRIFGDPSGDYKGQADEKTPFQIFRAQKLPIQPAPSNLLTVRIQAVDDVLTRMDEGRPSLQIDPECKMLIAALGGGYHFRRMVVQAERYDEIPEKDEYSHPADGFQYMLLGGGEGRQLLTGTSEPQKPVQTRKAYSPFGKRRRRIG